MMDRNDNNANPEGQALVRIDPAGDPRVHALGLEVMELVRCAETCVVASDADAKSATENLVIIRGLKGTFEEKRKEFTSPLNGYLKDINAAFKEYTGPLEQADKGITSKILAYRAEQERQRQEQERINHLRMEAARAEMELKGELTEPVSLVEVLPEPPKHYRTPVGMSGTMTVWKWEIVDIHQVPSEFLIPDGARISRVVKAGTRFIAGIRIYAEDTLRVTGAR